MKVNLRVVAGSSRTEREQNFVFIIKNFSRQFGVADANARDCIERPTRLQAENFCPYNFRQGILIIR
jgi:hypothetical protein